MNPDELGFNDKLVLAFANLGVDVTIDEVEDAGLEERLERLRVVVRDPEWRRRARLEAADVALDVVNADIDFDETDAKHLIERQIAEEMLRRLDVTDLVITVALRVLEAKGLFDLEAELRGLLDPDGPTR